MSSVVKTRFAPSPTGYLHIGGARTALFSYAFARHHGGEFVLRVEDTDLERSTPESVQAILDGMAWLNLEHDGEIVFQTQRFERYRAVIADMLAAGTAYLCYASKEELAQMRAEAEARGETPRYDRRWRPENGKVLPPVPADIQPVVRFKTPLAGSVVWDDLVKGRIEIGNIELDDLVIARADGVPTYNFCVVVDDWDMGITHVLRGDDHINNTPRQIHILQALGAPLPAYGHLPMILGPDGQKLSKRHGAAAVTEYRDMGLLPEAVVNYLARLGWSHGDDELFDRAQMVSWFDETGINPAPARLDFDKLKWVNAHWMKQADLPRLADLLRPFLANLGVQDTGEIDLPAVVGLYRERVDTLLALAEAVAFFFTPPPVDEALQAQHLTDLSRPAVAMLAAQLQTAEWTQPALAAVLKETVAAAGVKFPQLAMPVRVLVCGTTQTPSLDAVLVLLPRERVLSRLAAV